MSDRITLYRIPADTHTVGVGIRNLTRVKERLADGVYIVENVDPENDLLLLHILESSGRFGHAWYWVHRADVEPYAVAFVPEKEEQGETR